MKTNEITKALNKAICKNHTGKMSGMVSLSTSPINPICLARAKNKTSICSHCYSVAMNKRYTTFGSKLINNAMLLSKEVYRVDDMPKINCLVFRLEAFGDLTNTNQVKNYFNLCIANPLVKFALWTKNPNFIEEVIIEGYEKPQNLTIIYSSPFVNAKATGICEKYKFIDKVFTVYSKDFVKDNNIAINCGDKKCLNCLVCYLNNDIKEINELIK